MSRQPPPLTPAELSPDARLVRLVPRKGERLVQRIGLRDEWWRDLYHKALTSSWPMFLLGAAVVYLGLNTVFACLYLLQPGSLAEARPGDFWDAFFFSVQTLATIGYGHILPETRYANAVVTIEAFAGLVVAALLTGLLFARFSRPTARVMFSRAAVIGPFADERRLSVRVANERRNQILQAEVAMHLVRMEYAADGTRMRRFHDLRLVRHRTPVFAYSFLIMHPLDEHSPLHGQTIETLRDSQAEILVTVTGMDEAMSQTVHARHSYLWDEILWEHRFVDMFGSAEDGRVAIDYRVFHDTRPV